MRPLSNNFLNTADMNFSGKEANNSKLEGLLSKEGVKPLRHLKPISILDLA